MNGDRIKGLAGIVGLLFLVGAVAYLATSDLGTLFPVRSFDPRAAAGAVLSSTDSPADPSATSVQSFSVKPGDTAASIGDRLQSAGLIKNSLAFKLLADSKGVAGELAVGDYDLSPSMKPSEIMDILASGKIKLGPLITIPEGWRAEEIADRLSSRGIGPATDFMTFVRSGRMDLPTLAGRPAGATLEGYLFPNSYRTDSRTTADSLGRRMVEQFDLQFTQDMKARAQARGLTTHQVVTLASIIEREAVIPSEQPTMAAVFYNRLKEGMTLDTDPTVQYAITLVDPSSAQKFGWWKTDLTQADLNVDSPYNTYKHQGLPPGPICNPGLAAIMAVLQPAQSGYLYFVAKPDGSHAFAATLDEHLSNVAKYRK